MDYLWQSRHRASDLVGMVINIHNGDWVRRGIFFFFFLLQIVIRCKSVEVNMLYYEIDVRLFICLSGIVSYVSNRNKFGAIEKHTHSAVDIGRPPSVIAAFTPSILRKTPTLG